MLDKTFLKESQLPLNNWVHLSSSYLVGRHLNFLQIYILLL